MRQSIFALFIFCLIFAVGCKQKSTLEKAGERVDEVIDNVSEGDPPLKKKGPAEKFTDSIEDSLPESTKK